MFECGCAHVVEWYRSQLSVYVKKAPLTTDVFTFGRSSVESDKGSVESVLLGGWVGVSVVGWHTSHIQCKSHIGQKQSRFDPVAHSTLGLFSERSTRDYKVKESHFSFDLAYGYNLFNPWVVLKEVLGQSTRD